MKYFSPHEIYYYLPKKAEICYDLQSLPPLELFSYASSSPIISKNEHSVQASVIFF